MPMYDRGSSDGAKVVLEFPDGLSWQAHPEEGGKRTSHAISTDEGIWVLDPVDAPNLDSLLESLGEVAGVAVCSCWHARDAGAVARRHDVAVHIPEWMRRVEPRVDAPVERYTLAPTAPFQTIPCRPFPLWQEVFLYHEATGTLYCPDSLGTTSHHLLGEDKLGLPVFRRPQPPRQLAGLEPERILVGHGTGITEGAPAALETVLGNARRHLPSALIEHGPDAVRSMVGALR